MLKAPSDSPGVHCSPPMYVAWRNRGPAS